MMQRAGSSLDHVEGVPQAVNASGTGSGGCVTGPLQAPLHADGSSGHVHQHTRDEVGAEPACRACPI